MLPIEDVPPDGLISADVGGVADQVTARTRRPMVCRSPEANSGGYGQGAETAGHQEEGETVCENLAGRRCAHHDERTARVRLKRPAPKCAICSSPPMIIMFLRKWII